MELNYNEFVANLFKDMGDKKLNLAHAALGIAGEAGEVVDIIKKHYAYDKPLQLEEVVKELGDLLFYIQALMNELGIEKELVIINNMAKLTQRYGDSYSDEKAIARADVDTSTSKD